MIKNMILMLICVSLICFHAQSTFAKDIGLNQSASMVNKPAGIPLFTCDQAMYGWTEYNSAYEINHSDGVEVQARIVRDSGNAMMKIAYKGLADSSQYVRLDISVRGKLDDDLLLPTEVTDVVKGICFAAKTHRSETILVQAIDLEGQVIKEKQIEVISGIADIYQMDFICKRLKKLRFQIEGGYGTESGEILIDDVVFNDGSARPFALPSDDQEMLEWVKKTSLGYFIREYRSPRPNHGVVLEMSRDHDRVSLSGMGYAFAAYIMAENDGVIGDDIARNRILSMLRWLDDLNCFDGSGGWHGFPFHYFYPDGRAKWPDVSTIDWAICAAGIRVVRQHYIEDDEIVELATRLLERADWSKAIDVDGKVAMGFNGKTGEMNPYRWGLAFSEETDLVYLEAFASNEFGSNFFDTIVRKEKKGFFPSWFGSGFTYNWLQLWTGPIEPFASNSRKAFTRDAISAEEAFGVPLMGLTACATVHKFRGDGFIDWGNYIGHQGSDVHGTGFSSEVIRISPAPYGAALALPFTRGRAIRALRRFADLGYVHPILGFPDTVRMADIPEGFGPAPNWEQVDINIGPMAMAIEQIGANTIGRLYMQDSEIVAALDLLIASFRKHTSSLQTPNSDEN